jgi:four helix bundle protein
MGELRSFRDLLAWQEAHKLVLMVYQLADSFPQPEKYALTRQIRRAAISVPANIAEGFKRQGLQDKIRHYNIAEASLEEVRYYLILSQDLHYIANSKSEERQAETVSKLLAGLIQSTERRKSTRLPTPNSHAYHLLPPRPPHPPLPHPKPALRHFQHRR